MDICTGERSYFSQYIVQLTSRSPLLRYASCALAAKRLGLLKYSTDTTNVTRRSSLCASSLLQMDLDMDFTWYGAKYYEKAIQLMARETSQDPSSVQNHTFLEAIHGSAIHGHGPLGGTQSTL